MNNKIRAVFFDLFGTLLVYGNMNKAFYSWHVAIHQALAELGHRTSLEDIRARFKKFFSLNVERPENWSVYEARLAYVFRDMGVSFSEEWLHRFANISMDSWQEEVFLHKEALLVLNTLKQNKIFTGIISNFDHAPHVRRILTQFKMMPFLDCLLLSGEVHLRKPDPKIFELAVEKTGLAPNEILFVGDDLKEDIEGASKVGLQTYFYKNGASLVSILRCLDIEH